MRTRGSTSPMRHYISGDVRYKVLESGAAGGLTTQARGYPFGGVRACPLVGVTMTTVGTSHPKRMCPGLAPQAGTPTECYYRGTTIYGSEVR